MTATGAKVIEAELLEVSVPANAMGPMEAQYPVEIVDPGASSIIGQTPHRQDDVPVNIAPNEGVQKETCSITPSDLQAGSASVLRLTRYNAKPKTRLGHLMTVMRRDLGRSRGAWTQRWTGRHGFYSCARRAPRCEFKHGKARSGRAGGGVGRAAGPLE